VCGDLAQPASMPALANCAWLAMHMSKPRVTYAISRRPADRRTSGPDSHRLAAPKPTSRAVATKKTESAIWRLHHGRTSASRPAGAGAGGLRPAIERVETFGAAITGETPVPLCWRDAGSSISRIR